jgi:hypothetical protein
MKPFKNSKIHISMTGPLSLVSSYWSRKCGNVGLTTHNYNDELWMILEIAPSRNCMNPELSLLHALQSYRKISTCHAVHVIIHIFALGLDDMCVLVHPPLSK